MEIMLTSLGIKSFGEVFSMELLTTKNKLIFENYHDGTKADEQIF